MKKVLFLLFTIVMFSYAQCLGSPISTRVGVKFGFNPGIYNPDDGFDQLSGTGMHLGFGMGTEILNFISFDMGAQFRTTKYSREDPTYIAYSYDNLYFPFFLSLKAPILPLISPYIGAGIGINVQYNCTYRFELLGSIVEQQIEGANTNAYLILGLGAQIKLLKFRIMPEFTANINAQADDAATENRTEENVDYHISVGFYYAP